MKNQKGSVFAIEVLGMLFVSFIFVSCGSSIYEAKQATPEQIKHEFIKEFPDISKAQIFERTQRWIAQNFKSAKQVIDYSDKDAGSIVAKGIIPVDGVEIGSPWSTSGRLTVRNIRFTLTLDIKDGKARFQYSDIMPMGNTLDIPDVQSSEIVHLSAHKEFSELTEKIQKAVMQKSDF